MIKRQGGCCANITKLLIFCRHALPTAASSQRDLGIIVLISTSPNQFTMKGKGVAILSQTFKYFVKCIIENITTLAQTQLFINASLPVSIQHNKKLLLASIIQNITILARPWNRDTHRDKLYFIHFSTRMTGWLLLTFFIFIQ